MKNETKIGLCMILNVVISNIIGFSYLKITMEYFFIDKVFVMFTTFLITISIYILNTILINKLFKEDRNNI